MLNIKIHIDSVDGIVQSLVLLPHNKKVLDTAWAQNTGASFNVCVLGVAPNAPHMMCCGANVFWALGLSLCSIHVLPLPSCFLL